jgi:hypothetical protein
LDVQAAASGLDRTDVHPAPLRNMLDLTLQVMGPIGVKAELRKCCLRLPGGTAQIAQVISVAETFHL